MFSHQHPVMLDLSLCALCLCTCSVFCLESLSSCRVKPDFFPSFVLPFPVCLLDYSHQTLPFWSPDAWRFFLILSSSWRHQLGVPSFRSVPTLSTQRRPQIPKVKGSVPQDCSQPSLRPHLQASVIGGPKDLVSGLVNSLEQLIELRKILCLLVS